MRNFQLKLIYLVIALAISGLVILSFYQGLFSGLENYFEDLLVSSKAVNNQIVVVSIDNESIQKIGQWPWPREVFAKALSALENNSPKVLGIDVIFSEPSRLGEKDDKILRDSLDRAPYPVIMPVEAINLTIEDNKISSQNFLKSLALFGESKNVSLGHVNLVLDRDGIARRIPLVIEPFSSFSLELAKKSNLAFDYNQSESLTRIVYSAPSGSIRRIPFWRLLEKDTPNLKDKIVLIGTTAPDLHDEKPTPFSLGTEMSGVDIQANILNMLLSGYRLAPIGNNLMQAWIILAAVVPAIIFLIFSGSLAAISINIVFGILYLAIIAILFEKGIVVNMIHVSLSWILSTIALFIYKYFSVEKERRAIKNIFSKYVSKDVLNDILLDPDKVKLGGEEREVTVLFSDIRGFTTMSEKAQPKELVSTLNKYFSLMSGQVLKYGGVLDKYIGDAIMAFWGAPLDDPDHAENALKAGLGMIKELDKFNKELKRLGEPEIHIGVGIYTGPAIVGNIGSEFRFDYTAIGDTVNVASRLEGLNKDYKTSIIIGETTKNMIKGKYSFKFLGSANVKGREGALDIYSVER